MTHGPATEHCVAARASSLFNHDCVVGWIVMGVMMVLCHMGVGCVHLSQCSPDACYITHFTPGPFRSGNIVSWKCY